MGTNQMTMLEKLSAYYCEQGISARQFSCKHKAACEKNCVGKLGSLPEAYVGPEFEKGKLPRLLFVSSEPNTTGWLGDDGWGTLEEVRNDKITVHYKADPQNTHWRDTLNWAGKLLAPFVDAPIPDEKRVEYFAHTPSARCKDKKANARENNSITAKNCREFLKGEIEILLPDIVIAQGKVAGDALNNSFPIVSQRVNFALMSNCYYEVIRITEKHSAIKLVVLHPGRYRYLKAGELLNDKVFEWAKGNINNFIKPL